MGKRDASPAGVAGGKQQRRIWQALGPIFVAGVLFFSVLLVCIRMFDSFQFRNSYLDRNVRESEAFVTIIDRYTQRFGEGLSFVLDSFKLEAGDASSPAEVAEKLHDTVDQLVKVNDDFIRLDFVDPEGTILYSSDRKVIGKPTPDKLALPKATQAEGMVFVSAARCESCNPRHYLTVARRLSAPDGRLVGVVVARIDPQKLQTLAMTLGASFSAAVRIFVDDGTLLISQPPGKFQPGEILTPVRGSLADFDRTGKIVVFPWEHHPKYLITYVYVPDFKIFVSFLRDKEVMMTTVWRAIWRSMMLDLIALVACIIASGMFYRILRMRAKTVETLAAKSEELESVQHASKIAGFRWYPATGALHSSSGPSHILDLGTPSFDRHGMKNLLRFFPQIEAQELQDAVIDCAKTGAEHHLELTALKRPGEPIPSTYAITTFRISGGPKEANHVFLVCQDISEWHETRMQHAHLLKIEAVGQITGGVAHDFNNLLVVILGNIEEIAQEFPVDDPRHTLLDVTLGAAMQARDLTKRLLAFARKQPLQPSSIDIAALVENMRSLLKRTIGENVVLGFDIEPGTKPWNVKADRTQLETAILNLIINARDALIEGGSITVRVRNRVVSSYEMLSHDNLMPGEYVDIMVEDNGTGMSEDIAERAIEPYFTTKPPGSGSGLGLSQVYGFVKQSGGHFQLTSQPMTGTVVHMMLPRADEQMKVDLPEAWNDGFEFGSETILVVEDDEAVRAHIDRVLTSLGYKVISRIEASSALNFVKEGVHFDLLLTDVMLPGGMSGVQLAKRVRELRPDVPVMYVSGYAKDMIDESGRTTADMHFLQKPFLRGELGAKVRAALGSSQW